MEEKHHIVWAEVEADGYRCQKFFKPGEEPAAEFPLKGDRQAKAVRAYCNLHGLWEVKLS
jgi:superoxide reductase